MGAVPVAPGHVHHDRGGLRDGGAGSPGQNDDLGLRRLRGIGADGECRRLAELPTDREAALTDSLLTLHRRRGRGAGDLAAGAVDDLDDEHECPGRILLPLSTARLGGLSVLGRLVAIGELRRNRHEHSVTHVMPGQAALPPLNDVPQGEGHRSATLEGGVEGISAIPLPTRVVGLDHAVGVDLGSRSLRQCLDGEVLGRLGILLPGHGGLRAGIAADGRQ